MTEILAALYMVVGALTVQPAPAEPIIIETPAPVVNTCDADDWYIDEYCLNAYKEMVGE